MTLKFPELARGSDCQLDDRVSSNLIRPLRRYHKRALRDRSNDVRRREWAIGTPSSRPCHRTGRGLRPARANRTNSTVRTCAILISLILGWRYMLWRIFETLPSASNPVDFFAGAIFTAVEALAMLGTTASQIFLTRTRNRTAEADRNVPLLLAQKSLPKIAVLICTYNEDESILDRTIIGSLALTYPNFERLGLRRWAATVAASALRKAWLSAI